MSGSPRRLPLWLLAALLGLLLLLAQTAPVRAASTAETRIGASTLFAATHVGIANAESGALQPGNSATYDGIAVGDLFATDATADAGSTLFHYTSAEPGSVFDKGLLPGSDGNVYLTPDGELSPIQAHIDLGLPGGRGFPSHVFSVDANALSEYLGEDLPAATRVAGMPGGGAGGGWEVPINGPIPPWLLQLVR